MADTAVAPSMSDSIRAAMKEVGEKVAVDAVDNSGEVGRDGDDAGTGGEQPGPVVEQTAAERARDKAGRFAATETAGDKHRETLTLKGKPDAAKEQERKAPGQGAEAQASAVEQGAKVDSGKGDAIPPPQHWKGEGKLSWEKLPYNLKAALNDEYKRLEPIQAVAPAIQQYAPLIQQRYGGNLSQGVASVLQLYSNAVNQPLDFIKDFCQQFNIDPSSLGGRPAEAQLGNGAESEPWQQELAAVKGQLHALAQQPVLQQQHQIQSDIQSFQTAMKPDGSVEHPYFNDVRAHMAALMQTPGGPTNLKEAYDQACWANPNVRGALLKDQEATKEAERRQAIARAQGAAVSVSGAPGVNGAQPLAAQSVSDTLRAAMRAAKGGRA